MLGSYYPDADANSINNQVKYNVAKTKLESIHGPDPPAVVARLSAYRNVWWSMANEWDLVKCKHEGVPDSPVVWDRLFEVLAEEDKFGHLTSIHNCMVLYDHSKPWITHISSQGGYDMAHIKLKYAPKPIVWDEVMYEGDIPSGWGGLTGGQMVDRCEGG